jgi:hypothetical protein
MGDMHEGPGGEGSPAPPRTLQETIDGFLAEGRPEAAEMIRILSERETFAWLVDRLPHAIEAQEADLAIGWLKLWGAWHHLYPFDRAKQAFEQYNAAHRAAIDDDGNLDSD